MTMVKMMAPFTPFLTEYMYQHLQKLDKNSKKGSVHYQMMPVADIKLINLPIERAVSRMQAVVEIGRIIRDRKTVPIKYPLPEVVIVHRNLEYLDDIKSLKDFILGELNVRKLTFSQDKEKYGVTLRAEPDHKTLGFRLKGDFKKVTVAIQQLTDPEIEKQMRADHFEILGHKIESHEIRILFQVGSSSSGDYEAHSDNDVLVLLDMTPSEELQDEGMAREIINRVQKLKKKANLVPTDSVTVYYTTNDVKSSVQKVSLSHKEFIQGIIKSPFVVYGPEAEKKRVLIEEVQELKGVQLKIIIASSEDRVVPSQAWANVLLKNLEPRYNRNVTEATILLQDKNKKFISEEKLKSEIEILFGLQGRNFVVSCGGKLISGGLEGFGEKNIVVSNKVEADQGFAKAPLNNDLVK